LSKGNYEKWKQRHSQEMDKLLDFYTHNPTTNTEEIAQLMNRKPKWVDFMLSPVFQEDIPLQMYVFPVNPGAKLDEAFTQYLAIPDAPVILSPELIAANREAWVAAWTEVVLR